MDDQVSGERYISICLTGDLETVKLGTSLAALMTFRTVGDYLHTGPLESAAAGPAEKQQVRARVPDGRP